MIMYCGKPVERPDFVDPWEAFGRVMSRCEERKSLLAYRGHEHLAETPDEKTLAHIYDDVIRKLTLEHNEKLRQDEAVSTIDHLTDEEVLTMIDAMSEAEQDAIYLPLYMSAAKERARIRQQKSSYVELAKRRGLL